MRRKREKEGHRWEFLPVEDVSLVYELCSPVKKQLAEKKAIGVGVVEATFRELWFFPRSLLATPPMALKPALTSITAVQKGKRVEKRPRPSCYRRGEDGEVHSSVQGRRGNDIAKKAKPKRDLNITAGLGSDDGTLPVVH